MVTDAPLFRPVQRVRRALLVALVWAVGLVPWAIDARCPVAALLGVPCPGCGMGRAARLLIAGDVGAGLRLHPLAIPTVIATLFLAAASVLVTLRHGSPRAILERPGLGPFALGLYAAVASALLLLWLARAVGFCGGPV